MRQKSNKNLPGSTGSHKGIQKRLKKVYIEIKSSTVQKSSTKRFRLPQSLYR